MDCKNNFFAAEEPTSFNKQPSPSGVVAKDHPPLSKVVNEAHAESERKSNKKPNSDSSGWPKPPDFVRDIKDRTSPEPDR